LAAAHLGLNLLRRAFIHRCCQRSFLFGGLVWNDDDLLTLRTLGFFAGEFFGDAEALAAGRAVELYHLQFLQIVGDTVHFVLKIWYLFGRGMARGKYANPHFSPQDRGGSGVRPREAVTVTIYELGRFAPLAP
jgi:hypothetical protein